MKVSSSTSGIALVAGLVAGSAAFADVTAQDVWNDWKESLAIYGQNGITIGSETMSGNVLTVSGLTLSLSDDQGSVHGELGEMTFTENGDGTVTVGMASEMPVTVETVDEMGQTGTVELAVRQTGMTMLVSGDPGAMTYEIAAARYGVYLDSVTEAGEAVDAEASFVLNGVSGSYTTTDGEMRDVSYDLRAASADVVMDVTDPTNGTNVQMAGQISDLGMNADVTMPIGLDPEMSDQIFQHGLSVSAGYVFGPSNSLVNVDEAGMVTSATATAAGGTMSFAVDEDHLAYDSSVTAVAISMTGGQIPFPVDIGIGEYGAKLEVPLSQTEEPAPFAAGLTIVDLTVSDMIWMMGDPTGALPHDPITAKIDLSGTVKMFFDFLDPAQAEAVAASEIPGEVHSLTLNDLELSAVGAQVTGTGDMTFDNTDMTTFPGFPRPEGEINLAAKGLNDLMDKLVSMGLVPEDQIMGARMMMSMFAVMVGEDELNSKLEFTADGQVLANGQRIK